MTDKMDNESVTALPRLCGEYEDLSGQDQARCRNVLRLLVGDGAIDASVALTNKPYVVVVHRSGWVSSCARDLLRELDSRK